MQEEVNDTLMQVRSSEDIVVNDELLLMASPIAKDELGVLDEVHNKDGHPKNVEECSIALLH